MEDYSSEEKLGIDVYISGLSPESKTLLDEIKQKALEIEDPQVSDETYAEISLQLGFIMGTHPELGQIPPNVLLRYLGLTPTGLAEQGWIEREASRNEERE